MISIWEKESFLAPQDVIIVGSGFAGLWSAFYLKKKHPKLKVTILDRGVFPSGASTRNAGFACFGSLSELMYDAKTMGTEKMLELVEMRYKGLQRIQKYIDSDEIDFDMCGGYELFDGTCYYTADELQNSIGYLNTLLKPITDTKKTFRLADERITGFRFKGTKHLVKNNLEGYLHSGKLSQVLLQKVQGMGVQVFGGMEVKSFTKNGKLIEISTDQTFNFTTTQLLICTNAFANNLLPEAGITPARGQVLVTSSIKDLPWKGTFHSEEGFYYFRNLGNRVLLGGARNKAFKEEETTDSIPSPFIQAELERYLKEVILPQHEGEYTIEHRWAGIMGMGTEKMPVVKEVQPQIFCAIGLGGMGVAVAPVIGQMATDLMLH